MAVISKIKLTKVINSLKVKILTQRRMLLHCNYICIKVMRLMGNTLFEGVCIRLTRHCHKHDITPVMNMSLYEGL